jgi:hypothetical protein
MTGSQLSLLTYVSVTHVELGSSPTSRELNPTKCSKKVYRHSPAMSIEVDATTIRSLVTELA